MLLQRRPLRPLRLQRVCPASHTINARTRGWRKTRSYGPISASRSRSKRMGADVTACHPSQSHPVRGTVAGREQKAEDTMPVSNAHESVPAAIEVRSIDYVPDAERHGGLCEPIHLVAGRQSADHGDRHRCAGRGIRRRRVLVADRPPAGSADRRRGDGAARGAGPAARAAADDLVPRAVRRLWRESYRSSRSA